MHDVNILTALLEALILWNITFIFLNILDWTNIIVYTR